MSNYKHVEDKENRKINALENLDNWKVHEDDTDIRRWDLYAYDGRKIGEIENLIADTGIKKVRYIEVSLDDTLNAERDYVYRNKVGNAYQVYWGEEDDRHIIIPIGMVKIDNDNDRVITSHNLNLRHFANLPRYAGVKRTPVTPIYELLVMKYLSENDDNYRTTYQDNRYDLERYRTAHVADVDFYENDYFSKNQYYDRYYGTLTI